MQYNYSKIMFTVKGQTGPDNWSSNYEDLQEKYTTETGIYAGATNV